MPWWMMVVMMKTGYMNCLHVTGLPLDCKLVPNKSKTYACMVIYVTWTCVFHHVINQWYQMMFFVHPEDSKSSFPKPICTQKPSFAAEFLKTTDTNEADPKRRKLETIPKTNPKSGGDNIWLKRLGDYMERFVMLKNIRSSLEQTIPDVVTFQLPALDALSGRVIRHCSTVLEKLFETEAPLTWKIGVTHCPHWRWTNQLYGYKHGREKFKHMLIMYMAPEPFSVGMLEAAMIDKYQSNWTKKTFFLCFL